MKNKKYLIKYLILIIIMLFILSIAGCGNDLDEIIKKEFDKNKYNYVKDFEIKGKKFEVMELKLKDKFDDLDLEKKYEILEDIVEEFKLVRNESIGKQVFVNYYDKNTNLIVKGLTSNNEYKMDSSRIFTKPNGEEISVNHFRDIPGYDSSYSTSDSSSSNSSSSSSKNINLTSDDKKEAWVAAKFYVKKILKSPSSANFPGYNEKYIKTMDGSIIVSAWVEAENSYGGTMRKTFICEMNEDFDLIDARIVE